jgi:hypothetical protein
MIQYLAGIFDSEGYIRIRKTMSGNNYSYTYECRLYMCSFEIVKLFASQYNLEIKISERGINRQTAYYATLNGKQLRESSFISDMLPFLNEKRLQLETIKGLIEGEDKEICYRKYLIAKTNFEHSISGELSFHYLAGIIDGDGWLSMFNAGKGVSFYNKYSVGLQQRYKPLIDYMNRFEGSKTHTCKVYNYQSHVQTYSWQNTTASILPFLKSVEPFLIEKKEKCQTLIKYIEKYEEFRQYSKEVLNWWKE